MGFYMNEHGTKVLMESMSDEDKRLTDAVNSSRSAAALEYQNALYEKEIRGTKWRGIVTLILSGLSLVVSIISLIVQIINR